LKLSVVIPCYNAARTIGEQLEALANQRWRHPWEVIVADNRSTDASMAIAERCQERVQNLRIVDASGRQGQPYALNAGARAAVGESLVFCDADDVVGDGWLAAMGDALAKYDFVAGRFDTERLNPPWIYKSRANIQSDGLSQYRYPPYLPHSGGGALGVKRVLYALIGGFDESLPILHDTDLCWRLQLAGVPLHFVPCAVVHVRYRESLWDIFRQARNYAEYNVLLYKRYRALDMPELSIKTGLNAWKRFVRRLPRICNREHLGRSVWEFGWRMGRLKGSIKHRVVSL
jgi:glycosyltransferase involved in cell wall biosynthesis